MFLHLFLTVFLFSLSLFSLVVLIAKADDLVWIIERRIGNNFIATIIVGVVGISYVSLIISLIFYIGGK